MSRAVAVTPVPPATLAGMENLANARFPGDKFRAILAAAKVNPPSVGDSVKLPYAIYECSSFHEKFPPESILADKPQDQASRWTTTKNDQLQFLTIRLETVCVLRTLLSFASL